MTCSRPPTATWTIAIGDVTGKGSVRRRGGRPGAPHPAGARRARAAHAGLLARLNEAIVQQFTGERFCTLNCLRLEPTAAGARLTLACGGHPLPYRLRADGGVEPVGEPGMLVGVLPILHPAETVIETGAGESLFLYTDGVTEARTVTGLFGEERLAALLGACAGLDARRIRERVERGLQRPVHGGARDDLALLVIRRRDPAGVLNSGNPTRAAAVAASVPPQPAARSSWTRGLSSVAAQPACGRPSARCR